MLTCILFLHSLSLSNPFLSSRKPLEYNILFLYLTSILVKTFLFLTRYVINIFFPSCIFFFFWVFTQIFYFLFFLSFCMVSNSQLYVDGCFFIIINMSVRINLCVSLLIPQALKLSTM